MNINKDEIEILKQILSEEKRKKINLFYHFEDILRGVFGDLLVRYLIIDNNTYFQSLNQIYFNKNEYGKPIITDFPHIQFNLSHSGNWVVAAIDNYPVGIDVEKVNPIDFDIVKHYFSIKEYNEFLCIESNKKLDYFYDIWTLKESYIKALGEGLSIPLNSFSIIKRKNHISVTTDRSLKYIAFEQYEIDENYKLSLCTLNPFYVNDIKIFSTMDFLCKLNTKKLCL